jgi:phosphonate transport system substrate-binding protein
MFLFSVCPHDTAKNVAGWFFFNTYMQRNLGVDIHFEPRDNFLEERELVLEGGYQFVYANPFSAALFHDSLGFLPVAKPVGLYDQTVLVGKESQDNIQKRPLRIASATDKLIVHTQGLSQLEKLGVPLNECDFQFTGTHLKSLQSLIQDNADLAFVFAETWNGLSKSTTHGLSKVAETSSLEVFHCFCINPEWTDKQKRVQELLCTMHNNQQGKRILEELNFSKGLEPLDPTSLDGMVELLRKNGAIKDPT